MKDIYQEIERELGQDKEVILATIVAQKGSAPRTLGTRFLIRPDGSFWGSIGGGKMEAEVLAEAPKVFAGKKNRILRFRLTGEEAAETEMICGGELEIYLEFFSGRNLLHRDFFKKILQLGQNSQSAIIATLLEEGQSTDRLDTKVLCAPGEEQGLENVPWIAPVLEHFPRFLEEKQSTLLTAVVQGETKKIFLEPIKASAPLYIFGAGHVALYLCSLAKKVGFQVTVLDDRADFADCRRFPDADDIVVRPFNRMLEDFRFGVDAFVVIVTRGHLHDHQILRQVLKQPLRYVGMIGSRHKKEVIFKALRKEGFAEELIQSVHTPIGLDINAETPEEIAVSIVAELIQFRGFGRTHRGKIPSLSLPTGQ
ncbi:MAG: XdhC family protein [Deltaproteobacteria bacterium]|nr:XdhC family protein [Deltaproteobacteria bacterium]